ncbi:unnamed protein product [Allacma fusca]|uniref:Uncharacterized protein n=1 Tax=Allacma fusca TaxID=39272 RepID=A0A8J2LN55_9HEXA|nr:unnamed protein product [Allacma fusca]
MSQTNLARFKVLTLHFPIPSSYSVTCERFISRFFNEKVATMTFVVVEGQDNIGEVDDFQINAQHEHELDVLKRGQAGKFHIFPLSFSGFFEVGTIY